jgi:hypothetical protein
MTLTRLSRIVLSVLGMLVLLASAARAQDLTYNAMPGTDSTKFKSYKWIAIQGAVTPDQIVDQEIKMAIDMGLATKGLTKTEADTADLYVGYQTAVDQEKQWNAYGGGLGWRVGGGMASATSSTISIGTLGLDIYDQAGKQLVWRGAATKTIDAKAKPEKRQENINKAVTKLLKNYPPPAKK